ncbi:thylakoid lumenal kDa, chloroplastic [Olea europaea subsp. europaea]|uniref:Thylakoid lumenal kDa, chloroplastic n=1 Tax=Olea europaea subsp. europaea TaxID=158383 RepID=A0A8S0RIY0_OLEEU|nr:thylakoid lumenal kDa, chloroplastic [Olea europaea subsp. europaea]
MEEVSVDSRVRTCAGETQQISTMPVSSGHFLHHYFPSISIPKPSSTNGGKETTPTFISCKILQNSDNNNFANTKSIFGSNNIISIAIVLALSTPLPTLAIPSFNSQPFSFPSTPFSQAKNLPTGLDNGKIRPCPSINPGCVSTNPKSSSFAFPWSIPENSSDNAIQKLQDAILKTQKNVKIQLVEDTPNVSAS